MSYLSESQLRSHRKSLKTYNLSLNESLRSYKNESRLYKTKIFLSHKHDELEQLEGAISFLRAQVVEIYVDWLDKGMPKTTSGQTAIRIKEKIKENDKFILLATEGAINSKWCNWELGLGDGEKYIDNLALFPVEKDNSNFSGTEYLQIYPYIEYQNGLNKYQNGSYILQGYYVKYPPVNGSHVIVKLSEWLKR